MSANWRNNRGLLPAEVVKTQEWRSQTVVKEQNWWPRAPLPLPLGQRMPFERTWEEQSHRILERRGHSTVSHVRSGRRQMVVSLKELPVERVQPPPLPPRKRPSRANGLHFHFQPMPTANVHNGHYEVPQGQQQVRMVHHQQQQEHIRREEVEGRRSSQQNQRSETAEQQPTNGLKKKTEQEETSMMVREELVSKQDEGKLEPEQEVVNEPNGFRIRVEARGFTDKDFKVSIDASRVLALDAEHVDDNGNGTVTMRRMNRRWKLAEDVDLHSVRAYLAVDGQIEILGEKGPPGNKAVHFFGTTPEDHQQQTEEEEEAEPADELTEVTLTPPMDEEDLEGGSMLTLPPTPGFVPPAAAEKNGTFGGQQ